MYILAFFYILFTGVLGITVSEEAITEDAWRVLSEQAQIITWPILAPHRANAIRAQRDISANSSVLDTVGSGIALKTVLFEPLGYNSSSLDSLDILLNVGVQTFLLDLYYNEATHSWLLCPESKIAESMSNPNTSECIADDFNAYNLVNTFNSFIKRTNNDININTMFLLLRLHSIYVASNRTSDQKFIQSNVTSLDILAQTNKVATPEQFLVTGVPTLHTMLFRYFKRVFIVILENLLTPRTTMQQLGDFEDYFFVSSTLDKKNSSNKTLEDFYSLQIQFELALQNNNNSTVEESQRDAVSFCYDSAESPFSYKYYWNSIMAGFTPIINHPFTTLSEISTYLEFSSWAFSPLQPTLTQIDELDIPDLFDSDGLLGGNLITSTSYITQLQQTNSSISLSELERLHQSDLMEFDNRCAALTRFGWMAVDCTRKMKFLCQNVHNRSDYVWGDVPRNYMKAASYCSIQLESHQLALPSNVYENRKVMDLIPENENYIWINLNSLSTRDCWVEGLNNNCPYQNVISKRIFAGMISPSAAVAFFLFVLLILMQFQRLDVHRNRRHWKKVMNQSSKSDFDGVPA